MGRILIKVHLEREKAKRIAEKAKRQLEKAGRECFCLGMGEKFRGKPLLVIAVGGDGTLLRTVREIGGKVPVLGIAAGMKSALMQVKPEMVERAMKNVAAGNWKKEKRLRLQAIADGKRLPLALNEVMLVNRKSGMIIDYCVKVNGKKRLEDRADACIVATPTGSSGHAYSAGGKKMGKGSKRIAVVPSNSLERKAKPFYPKAGSKVVLECSNRELEYEIVVDGQPRFPVKGKVEIGRGKDALLARV